MAIEAILNKYSFEAASDLSTRQYQGAFLSGAFAEICTSGTQRFIGVIQNTPSANQTVEVALIGSITKWKTQSALAVGVLVGCSSGLATEYVTGTTTSGFYVAGIVIEATTAASGVASVLITGPSVL